MEEIVPQDITVVIQGPTNGINEAVESIREHLDGAEIIVSTWIGETLPTEQDITVLTQKPIEAFVDTNQNRIFVNSQIASTQLGLSAVKTKYVLKFRADHILQNRNICSINNINRTEYSILDSRITISSLITRNPVKVPMLFHVSDLVQFGLTTDMRRFWNGDIIKYQDMMLDQPSWYPFGNIMGYSKMRVCPEQALMLRWLAMEGRPFFLKHVVQTSLPLLVASEKFIYDNFNIMDHSTCGIEFPKHIRLSVWSHKTCYKSNEMTEIGQRIDSYNYFFFRYLKLISNKYVFGWFNPLILYSLCNMLLFRVAPNFAISLRQKLKARLNISHPKNNR